MERTSNELPEVTENDAGELFERACCLLMDKFEFARAQANGGAGHGGEFQADGPVDIEFELLAMEKGKNVNNVQRRIVPSMLQKGMHPDDVWDFVVGETMRRVGNRLGWLKSKECRYVRGRIMAGYNNVLLKKYATDQGIPVWLPGEFSCALGRGACFGRRALHALRE